MGGRCAVGAVVVAWVALLLGRSLSPAFAPAALATAVPFAWIAWRGPDRVGTVALWIALGLAAAARAAGVEARLDGEREALAADGVAWIEARVCEPPQRQAAEPLAVVRVIASRPALITGARLRLRLPAGTPAEWGDGVLAIVRLDRPRPRSNPGGFDPRGAADAAGLAFTGLARFVEVRPATGLARLPRATAMRWRRAIEGSLAALSPPARELTVPLVLGDRSALPSELDAELRAAGLIHLIALSGLHVAYLAALARGLAAALGAGVRGRALAGAACALGYVAIAGPLPSLARAAASELLGALARLTGRAVDPLQALAAGALGLLAARPGWARDLGFQLSCAATLGLVTVGRHPALAAGGWKRWLAPLTTTASAQLTALPLLVARFHAVSWATALSNLLAVPVSGLLLAAAWLGAGFEMLAPGTGGAWMGACEVLAAALRAITRASARLPQALFAVGSEPAIWVTAAGGALLLVAAAAPPRHLEARRARDSRARLAAAGLGTLLCGLSLVLAATARPLAPAAGRCWLVALDVGQGDALAIGTRAGWMLVDAGPRAPRFDAGESVVLPFLRWAGVRRLEALVLTHDDGDHTGGAPAVLRGIRVAAVRGPVARPGVPGPTARFGGLGLARGDTLAMDPPLVALWPPRGARAGAPPPALTTPDNAAGLVLELGTGAGRALLPADVDSTVEDSLVVASGLAVLKVGHHGSASSSGARFLGRTRPALALISAGARNRFGHPDPRVLARLENARARALRTDRDGALWIELSAAGARRLDWRRGEPTRPRAALGSPRPAAAPRLP